MIYCPNFQNTIILYQILQATLEKVLVDYKRGIIPKNIEGGNHLEKVDIFKDIAERTGGDIYFGVVGAVRTGKSTFIKKFMELVVIPNIENESDRQRAQDELPQSAAGRTIMTTEPKFVPNQAVSIEVDEGLEVNIRLVDCVGYTVPGAKGYEDENGPRMINTPWYEEPIPFHEAAEIGTRKVIQEHSTIGVVITNRWKRLVKFQRRDYGKPFIMIINTVQPYHPDTEQFAPKLI